MPESNDPRRTCLRIGLHVGLVALVLTILNAIKPPIIDDGIYLEYAHQIVQHPTDPYGFKVVWYHWSVPAIEVLCPPVLPYWLALGMAFFGTGWVALKLWMGPWCLLWAASLMALLRRFAPDLAVPALWMFALSALILPATNMMLDIPMYALLLASLWAYLVACDRRSWALAILAGLLAGIGVETKFNGVSAFVVIMAYGVMFGHLRLGLLASAVGAAFFAMVEFWMFEKYGASHFFCILTLHDTMTGSGILHGSGNRLAILYLIGDVCPFFGVMALWAMGAGRRWLLLASVLSLVAVGAGAMIPLQPMEWMFGAIGATVLMLQIPVLVMLIRGTKEWSPWGWWSRIAVSTDLFLVIWLIGEIGIVLASSPFAAARRFIGPFMIMVIIMARLVGRQTTESPESSESPDSSRQLAQRRTSLYMLAGAGCLLGLAYWATDVFYGFAVQHAYEKAAATIRAASPDAKIWSFAKWSGPYYARELGMETTAPDETIVRRGEYMVVPADRALDFTPVKIDGKMTTELTLISEGDRWPLTSDPDYYGGITPPLMRQVGPRVNLWVLRSEGDQLLATTYDLMKIVKWTMERGRVLPPPSIRIVMDAMAMCDDDLRKGIIKVLLKNGPPLLLPALELPDPQKRATAASLLGNFKNDPQVIKALEAHTTDPDPRVRQIVGEVLRERR